MVVDSKYAVIFRIKSVNLLISGFQYTVDAGYKNTLGSRKDVLIFGMFLYPVCSYNRHPLYN